MDELNDEASLWIEDFAMSLRHQAGMSSIRFDVESIERVASDVTTIEERPPPVDPAVVEESPNPAEETRSRYSGNEAASAMASIIRAEMQQRLKQKELEGASAQGNDGESAPVAAPSLHNGPSDESAAELAIRDVVSDFVDELLSRLNPPPPSGDTPVIAGVQSAALGAAELMRQGEGLGVSADVVAAAVQRRESSESAGAIQTDPPSPPRKASAPQESFPAPESTALSIDGVMATPASSSDAPADSNHHPEDPPPLREDLTSSSAPLAAALELATSSLGVVKTLSLEAASSIAAAGEAMGSMMGSIAKRVGSLKRGSMRLSADFASLLKTADAHQLEATPEEAPPPRRTPTPPLPPPPPTWPTHCILLLSSEGVARFRDGGLSALTSGDRSVLCAMPGVVFSRRGVDAIALAGNAEGLCGALLCRVEAKRICRASYAEWLCFDFEAKRSEGYDAVLFASEWDGAFDVLLHVIDPSVIAVHHLATLRVRAACSFHHKARDGLFCRADGKIAPLCAECTFAAATAGLLRNPLPPSEASAAPAALRGELLSARDALLTFLDKLKEKENKCFATEGSLISQRDAIARAIDDVVGGYIRAAAAAKDDVFATAARQLTALQDVRGDIARVRGRANEDVLFLAQLGRVAHEGLLLPAARDAVDEAERRVGGGVGALDEADFALPFEAAPAEIPSLREVVQRNSPSIASLRFAKFAPAVIVDAAFGFDDVAAEFAGDSGPTTKITGRTRLFVNDLPYGEGEQITASAAARDFKSHFGQRSRARALYNHAFEASETWFQFSPDLSPPRKYAALVPIADFVALLGGHGLTDVDLLDFESGKTTADPIAPRIASMPHGRSGGFGAALLGDAIFVAGGAEGAPPCRLDLARGEWGAFAAMTEPTRHMSNFLAAAHGSLYAMGGLLEGGGPTASCERFDPREGSWHPLPPLISPLYGHASVSVGSSFSGMVGGGLWLSGGAPSPDFSAATNLMRLFDARSGAIIRQGAFEGQPRIQHGAAAVGKTIFIVGGGNAEGGRRKSLAEVVAFDCATLKTLPLAQTASLTRARMGVACATVGGSVLAAGGVDERGISNGDFHILNLWTARREDVP